MRVAKERRSFGLILMGVLGVKVLDELGREAVRQTKGGYVFSS